MVKSSPSLNDKFDLGETHQILNGSQAIVRLMLMQRERDRQAGLSTAGYCTGYRGSPIAGLEAAMIRSRALLGKSDIVFNPGLNEDLAATALWGSQQAELRGDGKHDGVFGVWYGKGPGVDRTGDVFRHANHAGTSKHGGVIALLGDDHTCESSTSAHQSEFAMVDYMIPVLNPAGVQELLDFGLLGFALSRYAGVWVGIKCVKDNIEVDGDRGRTHRSRAGEGSCGFHAAGGWLEHPCRRPGPRQGSPPPRLQAAGRSRLCARQQAGPDGHEWWCGAEGRHHHHGQELSRCPRCSRRSRHRRGQGERDRAPALQGRHGLASGAGRPARRSPRGSISSSSWRRSAP